MQTPIDSGSPLNQGLLDSTQIVADQSVPSQEMVPQSLPPQWKKHPGIARDLLRVMSKGRYEGILGGTFDPMLDFNHVRFMRAWIPSMQRDPHLVYGVWILRGPVISKAKYEIVSDSPEVQKQAQKQFDRFWTRGISETLTCMEWGYNGCEVIYEYNDDTQMIDYKTVKFFHPTLVRPVIKNGYYRGMRVRNYSSPRGEVQDYNNHEEGPGAERSLAIPLMKSLWTVSDRRYHRWYGRSRYEGAFIPWYETWQPKGFRNIRHLAMYKYSFTGGVIHYPPGVTQDPDTGELIPNSMLAEKFLDLIEAGAGIALPSGRKDDGGWDYTPPQAMQIPEGLFTYGDSLRDEKWEGLGVPPEIAKQEATGSFAGRRVPQQAFYSFLQEIANDIAYDFLDQCLIPLIRLNLGSKAKIEIKPIPILQTLQEEEMGSVTGHLPGDENDDFYAGDEEGDPNGTMPTQLDNGRVEDRDSNAFNIKEKAFAKNKKQGKVA